MKIGVIQITSALEPEGNLEKLDKLMSEAKSQNCQAVFLPEVFYSMSDATGPSPYLVEDGNEHFQKITELVSKHQMYALGGSVAYKDEKGLVRNRALNFAPDGELLNIYDKINLFSCDLGRMKSKQILDESHIYNSGNKLVKFDLEGFCIGMGICFDLRFPEHFRRLSWAGANVLSISSAFTRPTGKAHWETLLRARAIENQCYVIASGQYGEHNEQIKTWGHSMVIDPWGEILANAGEGEKLITATLSLEHLQEVRTRLNVLREI